MEFSQLGICKAGTGLFPDLKIVFHWHVYWVLALPGGKSQAGHFPAQAPVHFSSGT